MPKTVYNSPVGLLMLEADTSGITSIKYTEEKPGIVEEEPAHPDLKELAHQLSAYFSGSLTQFDLPLAPKGTEFQQRVWKELQQIPYGVTTTYSELSDKLGNPKAIRAVARANGQNPLAIIIPCHRVIGSDNKLVGYAGGIDRKRRLLQHEGVLLL